ncbi:MAG TPA: prepilin-type N-terminal cleavage/methylation domain-containing protein [Methylophilus sp.]|nr:prepilin-type N-terminal cleavage/methylation domain-containing protein [Methylophilus sp.]HQQ32730.1 prepilin-type N-terminal cleavage/methylation domain-containing protein [Methylophilus sp.]
MKKQTGFTLIELAIVLVIIGLLLGGVLRGQELINSAKVKNMVTELKNMQVYIYTYQDKFKALPGDDKAATTHVGATNNGDGDGEIDGAWSATAGESFNFWQHVRLANVATGSTTLTDATYLPTNNEGGPVGIQSKPQNTITGLTGSYAVCTGGILGKLAKQIDSQIDDGDTTKGSVMVASSVDGSTAAAAVATTAANFDSTKYVLCMAF